RSTPLHHFSASVISLYSFFFLLFFFFSNDPPTTEIYTLSLHDALPICEEQLPLALVAGLGDLLKALVVFRADHGGQLEGGQGVSDRKSTRLNSSHVKISYAVFCLKKKKKRK